MEKGSTGHLKFVNEMAPFDMHHRITGHEGREVRAHSFAEITSERTGKAGNRQVSPERWHRQTFRVADTAQGFAGTRAGRRFDLQRG